MVKNSNSEQDLEQFYRLLANYGLTSGAQRRKTAQDDDTEQANQLFPS